MSILSLQHIQKTLYTAILVSIVFQLDCFQPSSCPPSSTYSREADQNMAGGCPGGIKTERSDDHIEVPASVAQPPSPKAPGNSWRQAWLLQFTPLIPESEEAVVTALGLGGASGISSSTQTDQAQSGILQDQESDTDGILTPPTTAAPTPCLTPAVPAHPIPAQPGQLFTEGDSITDTCTDHIEAQSTSSASSRQQTIQFGSTTFAWNSTAKRKPPANCLGLRPKGQTETDTQTTSFEQPQTDQGSVESSSDTNLFPDSVGKENHPQTPSNRSSKPKPYSEVRRSAAPPKKKAKKKAGTDNYLTNLAKHLIDTNQHSSLGLPATVDSSTSAGTVAQPNLVESTQTNQLFAEIRAAAGPSSAFSGSVAQSNLIESTPFDQLFAKFCAATGISSAPAETDNQRNKVQLRDCFHRLAALASQKDLDKPDTGGSKGKGKNMNPPAYESLLQVFDHAKYLDDNKLHILLAASGSVATIKVPVIIRELAKLSKITPPISIRVIITDAAAGFLADQADEQPDYRHLESLQCVSGVYTNDDEWEVPWVRGNKILHIELRRWADIMVVAPLSANTLAKVVGGMSDNLLLSTMRAWDVFGNYDARHTIEFMGKKIYFGNRSPDLSKLLDEDGVVVKDDADVESKGKGADLAGKMGSVAIGASSDTQKMKAKTYGRKRILVAPSMNPAMWDHPVTREHIDVLQAKWGVGVEDGWIEVLGPINKTVACGDSGVGAMMEATDIVERIWEIVTPV